MIGTMFGPYRIETSLGRGGMGEVYRAFDTGQNRTVALKCLLPHLSADPEFTARFRRESELTARLREPHVIPIHRYGEIGGRLFIDMRLVDGADLARVLVRDGPMSPARAIRVVGQVAAALSAAHADGLVHRDVKPSNVLLSDDDFVYLADFGIARVVGGPTITSTGAAIGSVSYMAPERLRGERTDHRSDVYALACVLYECLTGKPPVPGTETLAAINAHLHTPPPRPSHVAPGVPAGLDEVVVTGMAKEPDDRYPSAAELAAAARAAIGAEPAQRAAGAAGPVSPGGWWTRSPAAAPGNPAAAPGNPGPTPGNPKPANASFWSQRAAAPPATQPPPPAAAQPPPPAAAQPVSPAPPPVGTWWQRPVTAVHQVRATTITIGTAPDCEVVLTDLLVSPRHAELRQTSEGWVLADLHSWNGTFVNGKRISRTTVGEQDVIGIGHALFRLVGGALTEYTDSGDITFLADALVVTRGGNRLLDGVGFALAERSLMAIVGPSGAGKSTLLGALTGLRPADSGHVHYAGRDLYQSYDELRQRIGLVPQEDILHPQLTVRTALRYAGRLRFPADTPRSEQDRRINEVIDELGLTRQADQRISTLSGGQRKRTSVALELLTRPSLLFLDEPTSGLDPGLDKSVMETLRGLADEGRTVVVVTHTLTHLQLCDRLLVLAPGGQLAYFGPPGEALAYFGEKDHAGMFQSLSREQHVNWTERFLASPLAARYLSPPTPHRPLPAGTRATPPPPPPRQQPVAAQFWVLCRRYLAVIAADRGYALFLALLPLVLSVFVKLTPSDSGLAEPPPPPYRALSGAVGSNGPPTILLVLVMACAFMGFSASFRELVKERAIFRREQAIGVSLLAYLGSKFAVLGVITAAQAVLVGLLGTINTAPPPEPIVAGSGIGEIVIALIAVILSIMLLGLLVSALIPNADRGMPLLVVILLLQLVLCGMLFPVHGRIVLEQLAWLVPARWGFAMGAATVGMPPVHGPEPLWTHDAGTWLTNLAVLTALGVCYALATWIFLRRLRPGRGR